MAWNDKKNPWAKNNQVPPEIDDVIKDLKDRLNNMLGGGGGGDKRNFPLPKFGRMKPIFLLAVLLWLLSGIYIIDPAERGVVMRFGKFQAETFQGPHWHFPFPIERLIKVNVEQIRTAEIGFRDIVNQQGRRFGGNVSSESIMLTKDENMIDAKFAVQYKIHSAKDYLFNVSNPDLTLRQIAESVIRETIGKHDMDFILTEGRTEIALLIRDKSQELLDDYRTGLQITTVNMQDAQPPEQVQAAFSDAVKAREDRQRFINEAEAYANDILPKARGKSARMLEEAKAYQSRMIAKSEGEAERFEKILTEYEKAPDVTKERLYREALEEVLAATNKVVVDSAANSLMYLPINELIKRERTAADSQMPADAQNQPSEPTSVRNIFRSREAR